MCCSSSSKGSSTSGPGFNRPQSNGIVERLHRTLLDEDFRVESRKAWFDTIETMQTMLDAYTKWRKF